MLKVIKYGDERLRLKGEFLKEIADEDRKIISDMAETLYSTPNAIGLAATQVAVPKQIFIIDLDWLQKKNPKKNLQVFINPEILWESPEDESCKEGCLSFPEIEAEIFRPIKIRVKYRDINFKENVIMAGGFLARAIQHEYDHLNGILISDRVSPEKRKELASKLNALRKKTLEELQGK